MRARKTPSARLGGGRAFRGLVLTFFLSILNLAGLLLTVTAVGLENWTPWQFAGLFGLVEAASGLASLYLPNIWRLPVAELQTSPRTQTRLAASALQIPHWGAAGRLIAGLSLLGVAVYREGVGLDTLTVPAAILLIAVVMLLASAIAARGGVARPDLDVFKVSFAWNSRQTELPPISITASILQFAFSILTIPAATLLKPDLLYRPHLGLSTPALAILSVTASGLAVLTALAWWSRIGLEAPPEQQREADQNA